VKRLPAAAVAVAGFVAGLFPIFDGDLFWHLASGRWIVEHGRVPRFDPFRFSAAERPWIDHEWLFQVVVYAVERAVGLDGLVVARAAALSGFGLLLFVVARRGGLGGALSSLVALGGVLGVRPRFLDRPEIVTLFAIVLLLALLERRASALAARSWRSLAAALLLVVVWVNFHGGALLAPGLAGLALLGAALEARAAGAASSGSRWRELLGVPGLLLAALLANPYGWRLIEVPLGIRAALADLAAINPEWLSAFRAPQPFLFAGMAVTAAVAYAARRERGRWVALPWALPTVALAMLALSAVRHQALFYATAAPLVARCLAALAESRALDARRERRLVWVAVLVAALATAWMAAPPASGPLRARHGGLRLGIGIAADRFPARAVDRLTRSPGVGPLYNEFIHGGYLLWKLHPPRRVFHDGRMELEPRLLHDLVAARRSPDAWHALLTGRGAEGALVRYEPRRVPIVEPDGRGGLRVVDSRTANSYLFDRALWDLVDWDDVAMLFRARGVAGWGGEPYRAVDPEDFARTLAVAASSETLRGEVLAELERKLGEQPDCRRALALRERVRALAATGGG
jgi:hypothetical protein